MDTPEYPEAAKVEASREKAEIIAEFLEWLSDEREPRIYLGTYENPDGTEAHELLPARITPESLLYEFFKIDRKAYEQEKQDMLRRLNG